MESNKNNSSHAAVHPSPPLVGGQTSLLDPSSSRPNEEMIRRIVIQVMQQVRQEMHDREENYKMSHNNLPPPRLLSDPKIPAQYQLQLMNKVKNPTFTTDLVRDENGHPIKVAMYDTYTKPKSIISGDSILSSAKVKLILLDAEFCTNRVNCSPIELVQNVLRGRERKGPILTGRSLIIQLENGVGIFENFAFTDNSRWTKSGFRLAVMVVCDGEEGYLNGERVQEAVGESFRVLDRRGKWSQKPNRLKLKDNVLCIKKIGKGRASDLEKMNITIVWDFLKLFYSDEPALRKILCITSKSSKDWETMVEHVMQCADEYKAECIASNNSSQPQQDLVDPMERNVPLGTNVGHGVVGLESSEPNPSKNNITEATNKPHVPAYCNPKMSFSYELEMQTPVSNDGGFPQSEFLFDPTLGNDSFWGPHAASANKSFIWEHFGGSGGSDSGRFPQSKLPFNSVWRADDASAPNYNKSFLCAGFPQPELSFEGGNYDSNGGGGGGGGGQQGNQGSFKSGSGGIE